MRFVFLIFTLFTIGFAAQSNAQDVLQELEETFNAGDYERVVALCDEMNQDVQKREDSLLLAQILHQKGNALYELGKHRESIQVFNEAIVWCPADEGSLNEKGRLLFERAFPEYDLQAYLTSFQSVQKAEAVLSALANPDYDFLLSIYADLASTSGYLGFYEEGALYLKKAKKIYQRSNAKVVQNRFQANKAVLFLYREVWHYSKWQKEARMLKAMRELEDLYQEKDFNEQEQLMYAVSLNACGDYYFNRENKLKRLRNIQKGEAFLNRALAILDKERHPANYLQFRFNQNKAERLKGDFTNALRGNNEILQLMQAEDVRLPFFHAQRALIYAQSGQKEAGLKELDAMVRGIHKGEKELVANYQNFVPSNTLNHVGLLSELADEFLLEFPEDKDVQQRAAHLYAMGLQQFINCYKNLEFNSKLRDYYEKTVLGVLRMKKLGFETKQADVGSLLEAIENIDNRLAWQQFLHNRQYAKMSLPDTIRWLEIDLHKQLVQLKSQPDQAEQIFELENKLAKLKQETAKAYPIHSLFVSADWTLDDLQASLGTDELILRYKKLKDQYFLFEINRNVIRLHELGDSSQIHPALEHFVSRIRERKELSSTSQRLMDLILPKSVFNYSKWAIVPDGLLYNLSFETLAYKGNYLIHEKCIRYAPYLIFLKNPAIEPSGSRAKSILAFTPAYENRSPIDYSPSLREHNGQLKGANLEGEWIGKVENAQNFSGASANKLNFIENAPQAKILHLAMHAQIDHQNPSLSYLNFANGERLYLESFYGLDLQADLAVLSACNSGNGNFDSRRGFISLQRSPIQELQVPSPAYGKSLTKLLSKL